MKYAVFAVGSDSPIAVHPLPQWEGEREYDPVGNPGVMYVCLPVPDGTQPAQPQTFNPSRLLASALTPGECLELYQALNASSDGAAIGAVTTFIGMGTVWQNELLTIDQKMGATQDTVSKVAAGLMAINLWNQNSHDKVRAALDAAGFQAIALPEV